MLITLELSIDETRVLIGNYLVLWVLDEVYHYSFKAARLVLEDAIGILDAVLIPKGGIRSNFKYTVSSTPPLVQFLINLIIILLKYYSSSFLCPNNSSNIMKVNYGFNLLIVKVL